MGKTATYFCTLQRKVKTIPGGVHNRCDQNFFCGLKHHGPYDLHTKQVTPARQQRDFYTHTHLNVEEKVKTH